jgi:hypothetical protein
MIDPVISSVALVLLKVTTKWEGTVSVFAFSIGIRHVIRGNNTHVGIRNIPKISVKLTSHEHLGPAHVRSALTNVSRVSVSLCTVTLPASGPNSCRVSYKRDEEIETANVLESWMRSFSLLSLAIPMLYLILHTEGSMADMQPPRPEQLA